MRNLVVATNSGMANNSASQAQNQCQIGSRWWFGFPLAEFRFSLLMLQFSSPLLMRVRPARSESGAVRSTYRGKGTGRERTWESDGGIQSLGEFAIHSILPSCRCSATRSVQSWTSYLKILCCPSRHSQCQGLGVRNRGATSPSGQDPSGSDKMI